MTCTGDRPLKHGPPCPQSDSGCCSMPAAQHAQHAALGQGIISHALGRPRVGHHRATRSRQTHLSPQGDVVQADPLVTGPLVVIVELDCVQLPGGIAAAALLEGGGAVVHLAGRGLSNKVRQVVLPPAGQARSQNKPTCAKQWCRARQRPPGGKGRVLCGSECMG